MDVDFNATDLKLEYLSDQVGQAVQDATQTKQAFEAMYQPMIVLLPQLPHARGSLQAMDSELRERRRQQKRERCFLALELTREIVTLIGLLGLLPGRLIKRYGRRLTGYFARIR